MNEAITVSKLNTYIKQIFDSEELLHNIPVVGEVFGVSLSRNVIYFSLKDENATMQCVCFYPNFIKDIVEGDKIIATGSPNFYVKGGKLNFNVVRIEKVGQGKLFEEFLKLKQKLNEEGLFATEHKKSIPSAIKRIGVITSREGSVIQDIKNVAWRRNPAVDVVLYNTKVQGLNSENEIAKAIEFMGNYPNIDVVVVARGGGSLEDLWAYNTEIVARATYNCPKPIVSAVGHETDFTIIDFVSDLRAPTPSAAAELLTYDKEDKKRELRALSGSLTKAVYSNLDRQSNILKNSALRIVAAFEKNVAAQENNVISNKEKLISAYTNMINQKYYEIGLSENTLSKINPNLILHKGYAKIEQNGKGIKSKAQLDINSSAEIIFADGQIIAEKLKGE